MLKSIFIFTFIFSCFISMGQVSGSGYIIVNDDSLFYEAAGSGNVLLFIHDGILHREVWDEQFAFFSKNFRVIRYDRRGYGKSSPANGSYTHMDDLLALYEQLKIDSAIIVACSSGGALAIDLAIDYPHKVSGLVLVGAVVGGFSYTSHMLNRGGHLPESFKNDYEESIYYITDDPYAIYFKNMEAKKKALEMLKNYPQRIYKRQKFIRKVPPSYQRLNEIKVPSLILVGEFDIPDVHAHAGAINAGILQSRRVIISNAGHLIPLEQPKLFNEVVIDFFNNYLSN
jgi:3-oxoadipate enol-lactonase